MDLDRRQFLAGAATVAGVAAIGVAGGATPASAGSGEVDASGPFALGVASGDPLPDSVVLWTRLVRDPLDPDSLPRRPLPVHWEIATDASFRHPVRRGTALARPELGHSVHVDVRGLEPAREYAYRFRYQGHLSPAARTRTAPAAFADPCRLRFAPGPGPVRGRALARVPGLLRAHADPRAVPAGLAGVRIYRRLTYGRMAEFSVLDTRQYRTDQPGGFPGDFGLAEAGIANTAGTMTGGPQEQWLKGNLARSRSRWNVITQQVMLSRIKFPNPTGAPVPPIVANLDQWDGYVSQRTRLLDFLDQARIRNPVVLAGDIHSSWFSDLKRNFDDPAARTVAVEFTATSVSSDFPAAFDAPLKAVNPTLNPHMRYFDGSRRGYLRCELTKDTWRTDARTVDSIEVRESPTRTTASFVVESGRPGLVPA